MQRVQIMLKNKNVKVADNEKNAKNAKSVEDAKKAKNSKMQNM